MANEWIQSDGAACYNSIVPGFALGENGILEVGSLYAFQFSISDMTQGKLVLSSAEELPEFTEDGDYVFIGKAISNNLTFVGEEFEGFVFDGCIDSVTARVIPYYQIIDLEGNVIFELSDSTGATASGQNVQYEINWQDIEEGCYKIKLSNLGLDYESDCLTVSVDHDCTLLLEWTNEDNAFGFNYSDLEFSPILRVSAKKWHPKYQKTKTVFKDSAGNRSILKSETDKDEILTLREQPEYIHDALSIGLEHDQFYVDGVKYTNEETEYTPAWRKSSQLAPVEIVVTKDQNLTNNNCG